MKFKRIVGVFLFVLFSTALAQTDAEKLAGLEYSLNTISLLFFAVLVVFMQPGFALLEAGLHSGKNVINIFMKNILDFAIAGIAFWAIGFSIMYAAPLFINGYSAASFPGTADFFFQMVFAATAATIVSGAIGGRMKFSAYLIFSVIITGFIYPYLGSWKWGGGWLEQMGFQDFAGSAIVHAVGGFAALGAVLAIGPRIGRYSGKKVNAMPGHNMALAGIGVFLLWIGWFGFNGGSQLAFASKDDALAIGNIFVNTNLAASAGAITALLASWVLFKKPDFSMTINGILAGLVAITAGCDVIIGPWAILTGAIGGIIVVFSVPLLDRLKIDDPVGAIPVHGIVGLWGTIAVGVFGGANLGVQILGAFAYAIPALLSGYIVFSILKMTIGLRVSPEEELLGLDLAEHGTEGYLMDDPLRDPIILNPKAV